MRRDIGMILAGLGAFLILLAVAFPTYLDSRLVKFPLNYYYKATLVSPNTTYFSANKVGEVTGANVDAVYTLRGHPNSGTSSTAVWDLFTYIYDTGISGPAQQIQIQTRTVAFDRKTAQLRNCCTANLNGKPVNQSGVVGYVFPMDTQKKTYMVYDTSLQQPWPFKYAGTGNVDGILTYKFTETVPPTKIGFSPLSATDPEYYAINLTYWVDPDTGALLKVSEHQQQFLQNAITGAKTSTLFDGTFAPTDASVAAIVAIDNSGRLKKTFFETVIPIAAGVLGAALLIWGILLGRRRPDFAESGFDAMTRELAAAAPPDESSTAGQAAGPKHAAGSPARAGIVPGIEADGREAANAETPAQASASDGDKPDASDGSTTR
jgi:hypothetical protein